jgi:hypothetical protein
MSMAPGMQAERESQKPRIRAFRYKRISTRWDNFVVRVKLGTPAYICMDLIAEKEGKGVKHSQTLLVLAILLWRRLLAVTSQLTNQRQMKSEFRPPEEAE